MDAYGFYGSPKDQVKLELPGQGTRLGYPYGMTLLLSCETASQTRVKALPGFCGSMNGLSCKTLLFGCASEGMGLSASLFVSGPLLSPGLPPAAEPLGCKLLSGGRCVLGPAGWRDGPLFVAHK